MGLKLFVGSLPFDVNETQLRSLFADCGQVVSAKIITDKMTGSSKGFGFVEMSNDTEAKAAISKLNNSTVGARRIVVNEARPMESRPSGGGFGQRRGGFGGGRREGGFGGARRDDSKGGGKKRHGGSKRW